MSEIKQNSNSGFTTIFLIAWCTLCIIYLTIRAVNVPLTHDEAATFYFYLQPGKFIPFLSHIDANNHFLNSILSWVSYKTFGFSSIALRLPNLLFIPIFFYYTYRLSSLLAKNYVRWFFILTFLCIPVIIEFMGLCRGYGISFSLIPGIIFYFAQYLKNSRIKNLIFLSLLFLLALTANLNLIFSGIIFTSILIFHFLIKKPNISKVGLICILIIGWIGPILFFTKYLLYLNQFNQLYHGNNIGFIENTLNTAIYTITGYKHYSAYYISYFVIITSIIAAIINIKYIIKNTFHYSPLLTTTLLLFGNILAIVLLAKINGTNYPEDRTTLHLVLYFIIALFFLLDHFKTNKLNSLFSNLFFLIFLFFPIKFISGLNTKASIEIWKSEDLPAKYFEYIKKNSLNQNQLQLNTVGGYKMEQFIWATQNYNSDLKLPPLQYNSFPDTCFNFQLCNPDWFPDWDKYYVSILKDDLTDIQLLERRNKLAFKLDSANSTKPIKSSETYINVIDFKIDTILNNNIVLNFETNFKCQTTPFIGAINCEFRNKNNEEIYSETIPINWHYNTNNSQISINNFLLLSHIPTEAKQMIIYLWNIDNNELDIQNFKTTFYSCKP